VSDIKRFNGSSWVDINPKRFDGSNWVNVDALRFDGSKWVNMTSQQYTTTWTATWSQSYRGSGTKRTDYRSGKLCQGEYAYDPFWGLQRSLCGFNDVDMRSKLAGARIDDVDLYLKAEHWYWVSGGKAVIGYHNHSSEPTNFSHSKYGQKHADFNSRSHAQWIDMPNAFGEGIRDGRYKGFSIFASSYNHIYYGVFRGAYDGSYAPKIKITYTK
jgi:hypothetical protein